MNLAQARIHYMDAAIAEITMTCNTLDNLDRTKDEMIRQQLQLLGTAAQQAFEAYVAVCAVENPTNPFFNQSSENEG